jgi:hypothetical protein
LIGTEPFTGSLFSSVYGFLLLLSSILSSTQADVGGPCFLFAWVGAFSPLNGNLSFRKRAIAMCL